MRYLYFTVLALLLSACDLGMPRMKLDFSHMPNNEIGNFIKSEFPNPINEQDLKNMLSKETGENVSESNLRTAAMRIGMSCYNKENICSFKGYVIATAYTGKNINSAANNIYEIYLDTHKGIDSLKVKETISKITD